jgi:hypothetical protein
MHHSTCSDLESILTCLGLCVRWLMGTVRTQFVLCDPWIDVVRK